MEFVTGFYQDRLQRLKRVKIDYNDYFRFGDTGLPVQEVPILTQDLDFSWPEIGFNAG